MINIKDLRIVYMGTPDFSADLLSYLISNNYNVVGVITKQDTPQGRKLILMPSPVKEVARLHGIPVFTPFKIRLEHDFINDLAPDIILTFAYGQIVPAAILEAPRYACLNFHGSLLPKYRGASPIQMALMNNECETGVTLMEMVDKMDAGKMYGKVSFPLNSLDNFATVAMKMVAASIKLIEDVLPSIIDGSNCGEEQDETQVTYAPLLKKEDEKLNVPTIRAKAFVGKVQAYAPNIGAYVTFKSKPLKIYQAIYYSNSVIKEVGSLSIIDKKQLILQLKDGEVEILELQKPGKNKISAQSFINGEQNARDIKFV